MKLLVLSDLHIDYKAFDPVHEGRRIDENADVVVLAGDIDEGRKGLRWARQAFPDKPIIYVAGNHEFYRREWDRNIDDMREEALKQSIHFLEIDVLFLDGVRFLGCTMWTNFEFLGIENTMNSMSKAHQELNDYAMIKFSNYGKRPVNSHPWIKSRRIVPNMTRSRHIQSALWLLHKLEDGSTKPTVVITHHAPHALSVPAKYLSDDLTPAYVSDLEYLMGHPDLWIHGHLHDSFDYVVKGTRVVCNPRGYAGEGHPGGENENFNPGYLVEVG